MNARRCLMVGAMLGALGVALGAFGAHGLKGRLEKSGLPEVEQLKDLRNWETAVRYQLVHAIMLVLVALWARQNTTPRPALRIAGNLFTAGVLIFSGCLYVLVLTGVDQLGMIVPIGGVSLLAGWVTLLIEAFYTDR